MRKLLLAAAALTVASPINAQGTPASATAQDDLRCAAWAATLLGVNKDKPEAVASLTPALLWYLARYEGATGKKFEEGLTPEYIERVAPQLAGAEAQCQQRYEQLGGRLSAWGEKLLNEGAAAAPKSGQK